MNHSARRFASSSLALTLALFACSSGNGGGAPDSGAFAADSSDERSTDSGPSPEDGGGAATDAGAIADTGASTGLLLDGGENGGLPFKPGDAIVFDDSAEDASTLNKVQIFDY